MSNFTTVSLYVYYVSFCVLKMLVISVLLLLLITETLY